MTSPNNSVKLVSCPSCPTKTLSMYRMARRWRPHDQTARIRHDSTASHHDAVDVDSAGSHWTGLRISPSLTSVVGSSPNTVVLRWLAKTSASTFPLSLLVHNTSLTVDRRHHWFDFLLQTSSKQRL